MKIGVIGTDSSHAVAFSKRLIENGHEIMAFKGGSTITISQERIERFSAQLQALGVVFVETLAQLACQCEAFVITSVDASQHLAQFKQITQLEKPVFIDKPLAQTTEQAAAIVELAFARNIPLMSSSALRFADCVQMAKNKSIQAVDVMAPLPMLEKNDYFYYGIHALEIICTLKGAAIQSVAVHIQPRQHLITLTFEDGTISTIRGDLQERQSFQFVVHHNHSSDWHEITAGDVHFYDRLVDEMTQFFVTKKSTIAPTETVNIIRTLEKITLVARALTEI